jgi:hypothetical protein
MIVIHAFGWLVAVITVFYFAFKMYVVYDVASDLSYGGGGVPTLDAVIFPPLFGVGSLYFIRFSGHDTWGWWRYVLAWVVLTVLASLVFALVDRIGSHRGQTLQMKRQAKQQAGSQ